MRELREAIDDRYEHRRVNITERDDGIVVSFGALTYRVSRDRDAYVVERQPFVDGADPRPLRLDDMAPAEVLARAENELRALADRQVEFYESGKRDLNEAMEGDDGG